jgi:hypothetical protein
VQYLSTQRPPALAHAFASSISTKAGLVIVLKLLLFTSVLLQA